MDPRTREIVEQPVKGLRVLVDRNRADLQDLEGQTGERSPQGRDDARISGLLRRMHEWVALLSNASPNCILGEIDGPTKTVPT